MVDIREGEELRWKQKNIYLEFGIAIQIIDEKWDI